MRPLGRLSLIALRAEACRFALTAAGEGASKEEMLQWIALFERVQLDGTKALEGVYSGPVVTPLRMVK